MEFKNFESLIDKIEKDLGSDFNLNFREKRKKLAGLKNLPNQIIFSEFDQDKSEWVYNRGGKKEIQYHIYLRDGELGYGLGINSQRGSFNNDDPKKIANFIGNSFKELYSEIIKILPNYVFKIGSKEQLGKMEEEEFVLFGNSIPYKNDNKLDDLKYQILLDNLKKQFEVYEKVFELNVSKRNKNFLKEKEMEERYKRINLLTHKKQIILQGPPGTGKTREAKLIAKEMIGLNTVQDLKDNEQFKLIQFHPSYTYEDFVRGIVAESKGDRVEYKNVNKILADFAEKALKNKSDSEKDVSQLSKEIWVDEQFEKFVDYINDEIEEKEEIKLTKSVFIINTDQDAFRYKGKKGWSENGNRMLFNDIKTAYLDENVVRQDIKKNKNLSGLAHHHASYYIRVLDMFIDFLKTENLNFTPNEAIEKELKNYVLVIDEINRANLSSVLGELIYALEYRGEAVESMYVVDTDNKLILPPNLYIIGTMNTADRSVGHIDYAIRRRFAFVDVLPINLKEKQELENFNESLFLAVEKLFKEHTSPEFEVNDVQLGHSYFIDKSNEENGVGMDIRFEYEIKPILLEYIKDGVLTGTDIKKKVEDLKTLI
jgi:MoxR-like ATPase